MSKRAAIKKKFKASARYNEGEQLSPWAEQLNTIIFGADTPLGKAFDIVLIVSIVLSVIAIMLDSVAEIQLNYGQILFVIEWFFTILFTIEYLLRLICVRQPWLYARSFYGIVDFLSVVPTYLSLFIVNAKYMLVIRILRVLRIFRVFKLGEYLGEAHILMDALSNSRRKIMVFLYAVLTMVVVFGSLMYVVEGSNDNFSSIPKALYWAIVTLTTVGYGDIVPQTPVGQLIASAMMVLGYGVIAVPTGIYSAELIKAYSDVRNDACPSCGESGHDFDADFCKYCGHGLE